MTDQSKLSKMVKVYLKIKERRAELLREFETADADLKKQADKVKNAMLAYCNEHGVESVKTEAGMFYRTVRTNYWTADWEAMGRFIVEYDVPQLLEKRLHQGNMKQFLQENPEVIPPGLNAETQYTISVRRGK